MRNWLMAARPKTLAVSLCPILLATGLAAKQGAFSWRIFSLTLLASILIQIGTNFANEYYDGKNGTDAHRAERGTLPSDQVKGAFILTFVAALGIGLYLSTIGGWPILAIGLVSLLAGYLYTGGPYPLAYHGLGDITVLVFFGPVAVMGTIYLYTLSWSPLAGIIGLVTGLFGVAILVVNNVRDIETDRAAGKYTLAVKIGRVASCWQFVLCNFIAAAIPVWYALTYQGSWVCYLVPIGLFSMIRVTLVLFTQGGDVLNVVMLQNVSFMLSSSIVFAIGLYL